jgi:hypothetical protein
MIGAYSPYQIKLSDLIIHLRDIKSLTFKSIADLLISKGYQSPRGFSLGAESVFSIYKKRKIRNARLMAPTKVSIKNLVVLGNY